MWAVAIMNLRFYFVWAYVRAYMCEGLEMFQMNFRRSFVWQAMILYEVYI